ncbi:MAG: aldo/keto reductase [Phycisphaerae bacterium]|nr:aldo/keto reductase [Phycisphaerae bacterium]
MGSSTRLDRNVDRRDFLKTGVSVVVGSVAAGSGAVAAGEPSTDPKQIPTRQLGKTGRMLPILGYGGAGLPKKWGNPLSTEDRVKLVRTVYDRGVRYFDTAGNYMESQSILGEGLKGIRDKVYLVTKVETTVPAEVRSAVEKSLEELQTDYLDAILIHGTPGLEQMTVDRAMPTSRHFPVM